MRRERSEGKRESGEGGMERGRVRGETKDRIAWEIFKKNGREKEKEKYSWRKFRLRIMVKC